MTPQYLLMTSATKSRNSDYITDVVMEPNFGNSSISIREVIINSILEEFDQQTLFYLKGGLGSSSIIWD